MKSQECIQGINMRILLTGAAGFIGSYVLRYLTDNGCSINAIVKNSSRITPGKNINIIRGDINDIDIAEKSMNGCDVVIHLAAVVRSSLNDPSEFYRTNFFGTLNLLEAAEKAKIKKFIFTSTLSAHAFLNQSIINEDSLIKPDKYFNEYAESKARAEEYVISYAHHRVPYIILYPTRMFGPGPLTDSNAAIKAVNLYLKNKLPFLIDGGEQYANWAFVEDVARGIVSAALNDITNERFILGGHNITLAEVYNIADDFTHKKHLRINISKKTALRIASFLKFQAGLFGKQPLVTPEWLNYILDSQKLTCRKAVDLLDYKITSFPLAFKKTIDWLMNN
jgi:nucleoside-diphosphate-sugar epimerase